MSRPKSTVEVSQLGPVQLESFAKMCKEASDIMTIIDGYNRAIDDITERAKDELGVKASDTKKYAKIAYDNSKATEAVEKAEEIYDNALRLGIIKE